MRLSNTGLVKEYTLDSLYEVAEAEYREVLMYRYIGGLDLLDAFELVFNQYIKDDLLPHIFNFVKDNFKKYFADCENYKAKVFESPLKLTENRAFQSYSVSSIYNTIKYYSFEKRGGTGYSPSHSGWDAVLNDLMKKEPDFAKDCFTAVIGGLAQAQNDNVKNKTMYNVGCKGKNEKLINKITDNIKRKVNVDYSKAVIMADREEFECVDKAIGNDIIEETVRYAFGTYVPNPCGKGRHILLADALLKSSSAKSAGGFIYDKFLVLEEYLLDMTSHYILAKVGFNGYVKDVVKYHYFYNHKQHPYWYWIIETAHKLEELKPSVVSEFKKNAKENIKKYNDL